MKKLGLVVGINYPGTDYALPGCVNDASDITNQLVKKFNFSTSDIQLLINEFATKKNILDGLEWIISQLNPGDIGVFFYAGHGRKTVDLSPSDEPDMLDEALVPIDGVINEMLLIRDDEIEKRLKKLNQGVTFVVIFDSCFAYQAVRGDKIKIPRAIKLSSSSEKVKNIVKNIIPRNFTEAKLNIDYIFLAGSDEDESAYDNGSNGYFTNALVQNMKKGITYQELYEQTYAMVIKDTGHDQHPKIEGKGLTKKIFE
ncbi:caspase family protein [Bacillus cereus]|nr:caspase family protein [Bacillus cereus]